MTFHARRMGTLHADTHDVQVGVGAVEIERLWRQTFLWKPGVDENVSQLVLQTQTDTSAFKSLVFNDDTASPLLN